MGRLYNKKKESLGKNDASVCYLFYQLFELRHKMTEETRIKYLRAALAMFGLTFIILVPIFMLWLWRSGWAWEWQDGRISHFTWMILAIYMTLGVFFLLAIRDPLKHSSLIWFTVWSSVAHAVVMTYSAIIDPLERGHLVGDIPALVIVALVFGILMPRKWR